MTFNPLRHPICFSSPLRTAPSAWSGHVPFAMLLVELLKPRTVVELGTHYGVSYCAFCQAVKELRTSTRLFAIDTWQGDTHAGFYGAEVLADLRAHHDPLYGQFSELIQSAFDDALPRFADNSIDLLHIDGLHTHEAVKHDFEMWLPKMSERGVMLFHDTEVREEGFGVWRFWDEVKMRYPQSHFEFSHASGLGVLLTGQQQSEMPAAFREFTDTARASTMIAELFRRLGEWHTNDERITEKEVVIRRLDRQIADFAASRSYRLGRALTLPWRKLRARK